MTIEAQLPDGRVLEFPDGTPTSVIQATVKRLLAPKPNTERTWTEAATDIGAGLVSGAGSLAQLPGQLYGLATGDMDNVSTRAGEAIKRQAEGMKSAGLKGREELRRQAIAEAEGRGQVAAAATAFGQTLKDPGLLLNFVAEQLPNLIPGLTAAKGVSLATRGAASLGAKTAAAMGAGAVQQGADVGAGTYDRLVKELVAKGATEQEAAEGAINLARASGASAAVISVLANKYLPGGQAIERVLAGGKTGLGAVTGAVTGALKEIPSEVTEEVGGQLGANVAMRQIKPEQQLTEGLGETAGMAAVGAVGLGGVTGAIGGRGAPQETPAEEDPRLAEWQRQQAQEAPQETPQELDLDAEYGALVQTRERLRQAEQTPETKEQLKQVTETLRKRDAEMVAEQQAAQAQTQRGEELAAQSAFASQEPQQMEFGGMGEPMVLPDAVRAAGADVEGWTKTDAGQTFVRQVMSLPGAEVEAVRESIPKQGTLARLQRKTFDALYPPAAAVTPQDLEAAGQQRLPLRRTPARQPATSALEELEAFGPAVAPPAADADIPEPTIRRKPEPILPPEINEETAGKSTLNWVKTKAGQDFLRGIVGLDPAEARARRGEFVGKRQLVRGEIFDAIYPEPAAGSDVRPEPEAGRGAAEPSVGVPVSGGPDVAGPEGAQAPDGAGVGAGEQPAAAEPALEGAAAHAVTPTPSPFALDQLLRGAPTAEPTLEVEPEVEAATEPEPAPVPRRPSAFDIPKRSLFDPTREAQQKRDEVGGVIYKGDAYRTVEPQAAPATPIADADLRKIVGDVTRSLDLPDNAGIMVLDSVTQLDPSQKPGSRAGALVNGQVYLFRDGIPDGVEGQKTVFHELLHKGLRNLLPPAEYFQTMLSLYRQSAEVRRLADAWLADPQNQKDIEKYPAEQHPAIAVDEVLAGMAEQRKMPSTIRQLGNWLAKIADRLGFKQLARSIRTMGMKPLEAFVDDTLRAAGGKAAAPVQASTTQYRTTKPIDNITRTSELLKAEPNFPQRAYQAAMQVVQDRRGLTPVDRFRVFVTDNMAGVAKVLDSAWGGKVRSSLGQINPLVALRQAQDAAKMYESLFELGGVKYDPASGTFNATQTPYAVVDIFRQMQAYADARGITLQEASADISKMGEARRADSLRRSDKEVRISKLSNADPRSADEQIDEKLRQLNADPQAKAILDMMQKSREHFIDFMADTGRITAKQAAEWKQYAEYVPFDRIGEFDESFRATTSPQGLGRFANRRALVGSATREVGNIFENHMKLVTWMATEGMKAQATRDALEVMQVLGAGKKWGKNVPGNVNKSQVVYTYENGQKVFYEVNDPLYAVAFESVGAPMSWFFRALHNVSNFLRSTITLFPPFVLKQVVLDTQRAFVSAGVNNPYALPGKILKNFFQFAWADITGKRLPKVQELGAMGIAGGYDLDLSNPAESLMYEYGLRERGPWQRVLRAADGILRASDLATRAAIYDQTVKEGGDKALAEQRAREIINFRRKGASRSVGFIIQTVPFVNAYLQSMDLLYRNAMGKDNSMGIGRNAARNRLLAQLGTVTAFSMAYALAMGGDDEYEEADLRTKFNNWMIPGVGMIPVPPEWAAITKVPSEMFMESLRNNGTPKERETAEIVGAVMQNVLEALSFGVPIPAAIKPVVENLFNFSTFTMRPLEGTYQQQLDKPLRANPSTSELAKAIAVAVDDMTGSKLQVSPIDVDNFLRGYFASTGSALLLMTDAVMNPDRLDRPAHQLPLVGMFIPDTVGTRAEREFYEFADKVMPRLRTLQSLEARSPSQAEAYVERYRPELEAAETVGTVIQQLGEFNQYERYLRSDEAAKAGMSQEERKAEIDELRRVRAEYLQEFMDQTKAVYRASKSATP